MIGPVTPGCPRKDDFLSMTALFHLAKFGLLDNVIDPEACMELTKLIDYDGLCWASDELLTL